ncbi:hypothetical protein [Dokdonella soli]|uniref:DUF1761 domain-containing protein n=1 Tax=Dokdonella soli TaxID=529810 RepID=A0ABN1IYB8_9GAMM
MVSLVQLWLPILLSTVLVFIASSILHMVLKFWHTPDCSGFSNEADVAAAIRKGGASAGMYMIPYCKPDAMKDPAMQEKFKQGPVGIVFLRAPGPANMGAYLGQWFVYCLLVSLFAALIGTHVMAAGMPYQHVFRVVGVIAFMAYGLGSVPNAIWWGHPWGSEVKHIIDGVIYALITAATFAWLWPA